MKINIQAIQFKADQKLIDFAEKKATKLGQYFDRIIDIEINLKLDAKSTHVKDKVASVKLNLPGNQIFTEESSKQFEEAIDLAIGAAKRQLKKYKEKVRA